MAEREFSFGHFSVGAVRSGTEVRFEEKSAGKPGAGVSARSAGGGGGGGSTVYAPFSPHAWRWGTNGDLYLVSPIVGWDSSMGGARAGAGARFFLDPHRDDQLRHFLDTCNICGKSLKGKDIFMYTGMPFCSVDCRCERIIMEESKQKRARRSKTASASALNKEQKKQKRKASQDIIVPTPGTVKAG